MNLDSATVTPRRCLSVVMPCFNEEASVKSCISEVLKSPWVNQLVVVDDGSTDSTLEILSSITDSRVTLIVQPRNCGKGAALKAGFQIASSEYVIIQDADLEYSPAEYSKILQPLELGLADVVFGSRFAGGCIFGIRWATKCSLCCQICLLI
jgi:glycosyltransferase involved in cell wall biosynthesis